MKRRTNVPGKLLFGGTFAGFAALVCYQCGYVTVATILALLTITVHGAGMRGTRVFYK